MDGSIKFSQTQQDFIIYIAATGLGAGDSGWGATQYDPNSIFRGFVSFWLPPIPDGFEIESCTLRLYQYSSYGENGLEDFPVWDNVPGGDTLFCIMDHIDYGFTLDETDWNKGDPGNYGTLDSNIGIISDNGNEEYKYLDVTEQVTNDYYSNRPYSQYRIRFQIDTDWDYQFDLVDFLQSTNIPSDDPLLVINFEQISNLTSDILLNHHVCYSYPNPFNPSTNIHYEYSFDYTSAMITIYDVKGSLIKSYICNSTGSGNLIWDGSDYRGKSVSSGIYMYNFIVDNYVILSKKMLLLK